MGTHVYHGNRGWVDFKVIKESDDIKELLRYSIVFKTDISKPHIKGLDITIPYPRKSFETVSVYIGQRSDFGNGIKPLYEWGADGWESVR